MASPGGMKGKFFLVNRKWSSVLTAYEDTTNVFGTSKDGGALGEGSQWEFIPVVRDHGVPVWKLQNVLTRTNLYATKDAENAQVQIGELDADDSRQFWLLASDQVDSGPFPYYNLVKDANRMLLTMGSGQTVKGLPIDASKEDDEPNQDWTFEPVDLD